MVFCNVNKYVERKNPADVTILILIDGFLQCNNYINHVIYIRVTILILIDGFLQLYKQVIAKKEDKSQSLF